MAENFERVIDHLIHNEGGYVNHWADKGGRTIYGVTWNAWFEHLEKFKYHDHYLDERWDKFVSIDAEGMPYFDVNKFNLKDFKALNPSDVKFFYYKGYWEFCRCDDLPNAIDYYVFDFAVNSGPSRSAEFLQEIVGTFPDGKIGEITIAAVNDYCDRNGRKRLLKGLNRDRLEFLSTRGNSNTFLKGWKNRLNKVMSKCYELLDDIYIDTTKPLSQSRIMNAASTEAKVATGMLAAGVMAPPEKNMMKAIEVSVDNLETVSALTRIVHNIYSYGWVLPLLLMAAFGCYYAYVRRDDWFKGKE